MNELYLLNEALTHVISLYPQTVEGAEVAIKAALIEVRVAVRRVLEQHSDPYEMRVLRGPYCPDTQQACIRMCQSICNRRAETTQDRQFQRRVMDWMMQTFSMEICRNTTERNHRYLEESLELVQSLGCTQTEVHMLVDYVFRRPVGETPQEVGGALVTLAALCAAADIDMDELGNRELVRCWQNIEQIRAKQVTKPKHSP